jgi:hypothetical protein
MLSLIAGDPFCDFFSHHIVASFAGYGITAKPGFLSSVRRTQLSCPNLHNAFVHHPAESRGSAANCPTGAASVKPQRENNPPGNKLHQDNAQTQQLRYTFAAKSRRWDLNPQPPLYESGALPLSYAGIIANHPDSQAVAIFYAATAPRTVQSQAAYLPAAGRLQNL